jgi:osmotically-inducible protein OsmY
MSQPAALLILPAREQTGMESDDVQGMASLFTQSLEDLRLAEQVQRALIATGYGPLRRVVVTVHARRVTLGGRVCSYYLKQLTQTVALAVPGVAQVCNDLDVY